MKRSPTAHAALDQYRRSLLPEHAVRERALRALGERTAMGEVSSLAPPEPLPSLRLIPRPSAMTGIVASGLCVLALTATWLWRAQESAAAHPSPRSPDRTAPLRPRAPVLEEVRRVQPDPPPTVATSSQSPRAIKPATRRAEKPVRAAATRRGSLVSDERAPAAASGGATSSSSAPHVAPVPAAATGAAERNDLEEELRLMGLAHDALRSGQPERALVRLAEHAARFPQGELAQSRRMTRIMALCQAGRVAAARSEAQHFLARWSNSPYAGRVRSLCADPQRASR